MKIDVITLFPEMIENAISYGVLGQGLKAGLLEVQAHTPREFSQDRHKAVDDRPFGGGDGMILLSEPVEKSLLKVKHNHSKIIYLSPQGKTLTDAKAKELAKEPHLVLLCGRYGGIDQRVLNTYVNEEVSIGDYVLSGGELGALVLVDALSRFIPGVLGHKNSADLDSFSNGLLEHPNYTRPREFLGQQVPEILCGGNHQAIEEWKEKISALVTLKKRPDLFKFYLEQKNANYKSLKNKKSVPPLEDLKSFFKALSAEDLRVLGLEGLTEDGFHE